MGCGDHCENVFEGQDSSFKKALLAVTAINLIMFIVEMIAGHIAQSQALQADALDFLGESQGNFTDPNFTKFSLL